MRRVYFVSHHRTTPDEPRAGWYLGEEESRDIEGDCITGPFESQSDAIDARIEMERDAPPAPGLQT